MIAAGLPLHCVSLEATGSYDTHADQTTALAPALTHHAPRRCTRSSATSRLAASPTAC